MPGIVAGPFLLHMQYIRHQEHHWLQAVLAMVPTITYTLGNGIRVHAYNATTPQNEHKPPAVVPEVLSARLLQPATAGSNCSMLPGALHLHSAMSVQPLL
jgi:hypothetical protein